MQTSTVVYINTNLIGDDMIRVLASSAWSSPGRVKPKII